MSDLETVLRGIRERNQRSRQKYDALTAEVVVLSLSNEESVNEFSQRLENEFHAILKGQGEDSAISGADGSAAHAEDGSGEPA